MNSKISDIHCDVNFTFKKDYINNLIANFGCFIDPSQKEDLQEALTYAFLIAIDDYVPYDYHYGETNENYENRYKRKPNYFKRRIKSYSEYIFNSSPNKNESMYKKFGKSKSLLNKKTGKLKRTKETKKYVENQAKKRVHTHLKDSVYLKGNKITWATPYAQTVFDKNSTTINWSYQQEGGTKVPFGSAGYKRGVDWIERPWNSKNSTLKQEYLQKAYAIIQSLLSNGVISNDQLRHLQSESYRSTSMAGKLSSATKDEALKGLKAKVNSITKANYENYKKLAKATKDKMQKTIKNSRGY